MDAQELVVQKSKFTVYHTLLVKGIAMLLMLTGHLFWMDFGSYVSVFPKFPDGKTVEFFIGSHGAICVSMFLALSGYGMYHVVLRIGKYTLLDALKRILKLWKDYAVITILFIILDLFFGKIKFDIKKIILNLLALDFSYNRFAWFMSTYIVIMLVFPLAYSILKKRGLVFKLIAILVVKAGITIISLGGAELIAQFPEAIYRVCIEPFMFLPVFLIGYICAEYHFFEKAYDKFIYGKLEKLRLTGLLFIVIAVIWLFPFTILDNVTAPALCFITAYLFSGSVFERFFQLIGKYSTLMWLMHYPIMVLLLNSVVYFPRVSILIYIWLVVILLVVAYSYQKVKEEVNSVKKNK